MTAVLENRQLWRGSSQSLLPATVPLSPTLPSPPLALPTAFASLPGPLPHQLGASFPRDSAHLPVSLLRKVVAASTLSPVQVLSGLEGYPWQVPMSANETLQTCPALTSLRLSTPHMLRRRGQGLGGSFGAFSGWAPRLQIQAPRQLSWQFSGILPQFLQREAELQCFPASLACRTFCCQKRQFLHLQLSAAYPLWQRKGAGGNQV